MEAKHTMLLDEGPFGVIGDMVPLPKRIELAAVEVVVVDERRLGFLGVTGIGFEPCIGRFTQIARQADERKVVVPGDGNQGNHAAGAAMIGHDDAPPFARGRIAHAALVQPHAAVVGVGARRRHGGHAQRFALHHGRDSPRAVNRVCPGDHLVDCTAGDGGNVVVFALDLVEVMAFAHPLAARRYGELVADVGDE